MVNISSVGGLIGQPFNDIYCAAKFALEGYAESLASYLQSHFGIRVTAIEPGDIETEFANSVTKQIATSGGILDDRYKSFLRSMSLMLWQEPQPQILKPPIKRRSSC
ncbi:MAG: SDR family NAD(P)-dependent oxidoreductase [Arenicella sp.]|nr:SDR family NAD(P)-dependent oxidoreductase [Arenicella sp.]